MKSSIVKLFRNSQLLAVALLLGGTVAVSAIADASVAGKNVNEAKKVEKSGFIQQSDSQKKELSEKWGIELVAMRSTAAGHMVDFRYRVLDAEKAAPLFERQTKPYLIHQGSGKVLAVPNTAKLGSLRNSNTPQEGRTYWMFFGNHHGVVQSGDKVTVAIGDFRAADIEVY